MLFLRWVKFSNVSSTGLKLNLTWHTRLILSALVPPLLILGSALGIRLMLDSDFGDEVKAIKSYKDRVCILNKLICYLYYIQVVSFILLGKESLLFW